MYLVNAAANATPPSETAAGKYVYVSAGVLLPVAMVQLPPNAQLVPFTFVDAGINAAAPSTFVAAPLGSCTAPCADVVAAGS